MTATDNQTLLSTSHHADLPEHWQAEIAAQLLPGEAILDWVEVDLDATLNFRAGIIALTQDSLIAKSPGATTWSRWPMVSGS